ncbi:MAG TPA: hypothetical protein VGM03_04410 [Phycisphaerae bacterium]|jgi:hypothetical protein
MNWNGFISLGIAVTACVVTPATHAANGQCDAHWLPGPGFPGLNAQPQAATTWDPDGPGPQPPLLVVGGLFSVAGNTSASYIAAWNGTSWSSLGTGTTGVVDAVAVFNDGSGSALYAGGGFVSAGGVPANRIAKWNGTSWSALGTGIGPIFSQVLALAVFDDGTGSALYAAGDFTTAGGAPVNYIAKWNGTNWSPVGAGLGYIVLALKVFDDGTGPALYAGGRFTTAGGAPANYVAKWNGTSWSALATGMNDWVQDLAVFDDGSGPALYAGGNFTTADGVTAYGVAKWNGVSWSALASQLNAYAIVRTLTVFNGGTGPALYVGGYIISAGGNPAGNIAKWSGATWSSPVGLGGDVYELTVFDDGNGPALYAGGLFTGGGGVAVNHIAKWNGMGWSPLGAGLNDSVSAVGVFDAGAGPALYAGGQFHHRRGHACEPNRQVERDRLVSSRDRYRRRHFSVCFRICRV